MTKQFLDSAYPPNDAQLEAAKTAGYDGWNGYFAGPHILNGWLKADFDRVKRHGLATLAYCSGWSPAAAMRAQSAAWGVKICLDVEGGIRALIKPDDHEYLKAATPRPVPRPPEHSPRETHLFAASSWVQPWLSASGGGVYGNYWVHPGLHAAFYVLAAYPTSGDPSHVSWATAYGPRPGALCGWQWAGSHNFAGRTVDSNWFDDALATYLHGGVAPSPTPDTGDDDMLYVSAIVAKSGTVKVFAAGSSYIDPSAKARPVGPLAAGATIGVDGYRFTDSAVQSTDRGAGAGPGPDYIWWHATSGQWVPDAILDTSSIPGAPVGAAVSALPVLHNYFASADSGGGGGGGGVTIEQVRAEVAKVKVPTKGRITGGDVELA